MRPFLLISTRAQDEAADGEYAAFLRYSGLAEGELHRIRLEQAPLPRIDLDAYSGLLLGGSPFTTSDPVTEKSAVQVRVEQELGALLDDVVARDFPFFGACYGVGTLGVHRGGVVDRRFGEPVGAITVTLTAEGLSDPLLAGMPEAFSAFVGHKEAVSVLPPGAVLLASSAACPVQMFRMGENLYATQFHPELDVEGILTRVRVYRGAGYFPPGELEALEQRLAGAVVTEPQRLLKTFVARYG